ncbi:MAG: discoidin domain-containing protein [Fimbriimonadales bacterium]|nr:discoidin domain-containing protein [Fimbriimonadales bacterium]
MLISSIILASVLVQGASTEIVLYRGASLLNDPHTRYWSAEDTTLVRENPERSSGQSRVIAASRSKRTLIRFGDLRRAIPPNSRIVSARLVLSVELAAGSGEATLSRFGARWNEGGGAGENQPIPPDYSTSWSFQFFATDNRAKRWQGGGLQHVAVTPSSKAAFNSASTEIVFDGLERDVQEFYDKWYENHGWSIDANVEINFESAQSDGNPPRLEISYAPVAERTGPDLSVVSIERTPEYERYDNRGDAYVRMEVDGHESGVMANPGGASTQKWPRDGEEVTYTAVIKNVGSQRAEGFTFEWKVNDEVRQKGEHGGALDPGATTRIQFKTQFRNDHLDHRTQPIGILIKPKADVFPGNDYLEIQANALNLGIWVDESFHEMFSKQVNGAGTRSFEDWIQWQFRIWNEVFLKHSRFSFAQDGCRERMRIGRITIVPNGTLKGGAHIPNDTPTLIYDGEWGFDGSFGDASGYIDAVRRVADRALIHEMSHQVGLIDLYWMNVDPSLPNGEGGKVKLVFNDSVVTRGKFDPFAGLMGGGDTRNETFIPPQLPIPQREIDSPIYKSYLFRPTDLYALTDVGALNANLGYRRGFYGEFMYSMPRVVLVTASDLFGIPVTSGTLSFYQMKNGAIPNEPPVFQLQISGGSAILPNRTTGLEESFTTLTGHTLAPNPFGRIDVVGTNGVFLVRLDTFGQTEWTWLKAWQLVDAYFRGARTGAFVYNLEFNVAPRPIRFGNLALNRVVTDSRESPPEGLRRLVDGDAETIYELGGNEGDWFEIDIGRDRPIGEVRFILRGDANAMWNQFDIMVYSTGQRANEARLFARELNWRQAVPSMRDIDPKDFDKISVAYRGRPQTARFIRFVNKSTGGGRLAGIEVRETDPPR